MDMKAMLVFVFMCLFLNARVSLGGNTISANQSLSGDHTIESSGGVFVLGFFKPGKSSKYYIGMWYKQVTPQTVVWVANREQPVSDTFASELKISDGNLALFNESKVPIWSTNLNSTGSLSVVTAVLNDNGNLVLNERSNLSKILWQSFDNPAHTWLPGGKISYNNVTKTHQRLTSWKNEEDPSPGLYTLELDPSDDSYTILWNRTEKYWSSGPWNGQIFSWVPEMRRSYIYNFDFVVTSTEKYFTYSVYNNSNIKISRFMMDVSGQIKQHNWLASSMWYLFWSQPRRQCEVYAFCGVYGSCTENSLPFCRCLTGFEPKSPGNWNLSDFSDGCVRKTKLHCGNSSLAMGEEDKFLELSSVSLPENEKSLEARSLSECKSSCLNNCSCNAYAYESNGCSIWTEELLNLKQLAVSDGNGKTLFVRLAASEIPSPKDNKGVFIGAVVGSVAGVVVLGLILFLVLRYRSKRVGKGKAVEGSLVAFGYRDLQNATKNFSEKLGGGGFGSVFKGTLSDSTVVAVKKLQSVSQGEKQFRMEVSTIGTIQHVNLVRLRGFCSEGVQKLLVYDYMPNGSLDSHLFNETKTEVLDWKTRYQIALGTARGLVYLHEKCRDCIIHCDIKPENILLDSELCPKVADFGLAKLVGRDFSRVLTTMRGTRGYLAPEWIAGVAITAKADVYSFGMMLFEFVYGKRNSEHSEDGKVKFFPTLAASVIVEGGDVLSLLDSRLERNDVLEEEVKRVCRVACWCIQDDEAHRPSMSQVVQILEGVIDVNVPPIPRALHVFGDNQDNIIFFTESSSGQSSYTQSIASSASSRSQIKSTVSCTSAAQG